MKIENHDIAVRSSHSKVSSKQVRFETQLQQLESGRNEGLGALKKRENRLVERLRYELLLRLLHILGGCRHHPDETVPVRFEATDPRARETVRIIEQTIERQSISVQIDGCVRSANGEFAIRVDLAVSQTFVSEHQISAARFYDPLVINLEGEVPQLDTATFTFDIDNDGTADQVSRLKAGNGFLTLDANGNGKVDGGCELFGARSGHGFVELSMHDADGNGWIDENDPVFDRLRIWTTEEGQERLIGLGEAGVGAVYLGSAYTPMDYKSVEGEVLGRLRSTGFYLYEDGRSGTVGEIDFARRDREETPDALRRMLASLGA